MHILLGLSSLLLIILGGYVVLGLLRRVGSWRERRDVQCFVLAIPMVSLGLGLGGLHHFLGRACLKSAPSWDALLGITFPLVMVLIALFALGFGLLRLVLMTRSVACQSLAASPEAQARLDDLAKRLDAPRARLRLCLADDPRAFTCGVIRPTIVLSTWMLTHLDTRELEAVMAHELEHVARRDYLVIWLATMLRDAFCYVPASWTAYRQLQQEKELACDDGVVQVTQRPLALAGALTKVWLQAVDGSHHASLATLQPLVGNNDRMNTRIERLLATPQQMANSAHLRIGTLGVSVLALIMLLLLEAANVTLMLLPMGCGPASLLGMLF